MSTPSRAHDSPLCDAGTSAALRGRSRTCPIDDSTMKSPPRKREIVRAFAGDSPITRGLAIGKRDLAGPAANVKQRPRRRPLCDGYVSLTESETRAAFRAFAP